MSCKDCLTAKCQQPISPKTPSYVLPPSFNHCEVKENKSAIIFFILTIPENHAKRTDKTRGRVVLDSANFSLHFFMYLTSSETVLYHTISLQCLKCSTRTSVSSVPASGGRFVAAQSLELSSKGSESRALNLSMELRTSLRLMGLLLFIRTVNWVA